MHRIAFLTPRVALSSPVTPVASRCHLASSLRVASSRRPFVMLRLVASPHPCYPLWQSHAVPRLSHAAPFRSMLGTCWFVLFSFIFFHSLTHLLSHVSAPARSFATRQLCRVPLLPYVASLMRPIATCPSSPHCICRVALVSRRLYHASPFAMHRPCRVGLLPRVAYCVASLHRDTRFGPAAEMEIVWVGRVERERKCKCGQSSSILSL